MSFTKAKIFASLSKESFGRMGIYVLGTILCNFVICPMDIRLVNIGFGNIVSANRVIAIVSPESAPIKRIISDAKESKQLVDATYGRRTRAVIITDSGHVILSAIQPETVANRFMVNKDGYGES